MSAKVSIIRCKDYESENVYRQVKEGVNLLGDISSFVNKGEKVLLKPNFLVGRAPEKCVNTHPAIIHAVARLVLEAGATPVIGDGPQLGSALKVAEKCGAADVARDLGIELVDFEPVDVTHPDGKHFKHFTVGKAVLEADKIINLPKFKTHGLTLLTLAVKNIFGCIPGARKAQWHVRTSQGGSEYFSKMLLDLYSFINPVLSIVDGIVAMEGKGPGFGTPRDLGLIIAGTDAVAVDSVISEVLGVNPEKFPTLKIALNENYGTPHLSNIEVLGEPVNEVKVNDYQFPPKITEFKGFAKIFMGFLKGQLTTHPFIDSKLCKKCNNCVEACPLECIAAYEGGLIINSKKCIQCLCCMEICPDGAVDLKEGFLLKLFKNLKK
jgi:uncharacterized protein (DUF362 family)/NAD-dependent dihydropyrimidine dehydrogenase PreA subunit